MLSRLLFALFARAHLTVFVAFFEMLFLLLQRVPRACRHYAVVCAKLVLLSIILASTFVTVKQAAINVCNSDGF